MVSQFEIECPICDICTEVTVKYDQEKPAHCPMCGEDVDSTCISEED